MLQCRARTSPTLSACVWFPYHHHHHHHPPNPSLSQTDRERDCLPPWLPSSSTCSICCGYRLPPRTAPSNRQTLHKPPPVTYGDHATEGQQCHTQTHIALHLFVYLFIPNSQQPDSTLRTGGCHGNYRIPWAMHEPVESVQQSEKTARDGNGEEKLSLFILLSY